MIYEGKAITVKALESGIVELNFDLKGESVNKFNRLTLNDLRQAVDAIKADASVKGVIVTSGKDVFIVGADITEFVDNFKMSDEELVAGNLEANKIFSDFEDLGVPTVAAINGIALGGGFEMCMAADYRVMSTVAKVGLPEVKLGIYPGFGGTVRLPRLIGVDNAVEWIASGKENRAEDALKVRAVDAVVAPQQLQAAALDLIKRAISGELDYKAKRQPKLDKLKLNAIEQMMAFETSKGFVAGQAGPNYPAPVEAIKTIQKAANFGRDKAIEVEAAGFVKLAKTSVAQSLVGLFLSDQELKKKAKAYDKQARDVKLAAVLGAGIMGGGIAYQSAVKGTPILMKDIREEGIQMGLNEASKLLGKRVEKGRLTPAKMAEALNAIRPTMSYGDFGHVDIVVEAVVENPKIKQSVLAEVEGLVRDDAIIASNTSTISISLLAQALKRPENFCGMHFFNPVHMMPLVEVIRGEKTSETAIATTVAYAKKMGKSPVVVNDCPGFLVNRVLFPYFGGFARAIAHGVDFVRADKVMEKFGWPMGPAYLMDVVGMDTGHHGRDVMAEGFPDRMKDDTRTAVDVMYDANRLGQKNGKGFYAYEMDKKGKPKKVVDPQSYELLKPVVSETRELSDEDIINYMMIPLCLETVRCLEDNIVETAAEADMGLIYGIGFPPFRGGALRYIDSIGVAEFVALADKYADLGPLYHPTAKLREMAANGQSFYG
ncbi:MAG: fatty acid oxidation complex subunit alpha FadB [Pseudomonas sp.]|jgi:3-hydroxyacyl-CoA dehydrogenase/enoyl-CoA hydratase/3-hydroxybutyryl-CoA epimerase/enoyl-CoA isomerase|uniref:fatty acid oxidation complex subunit alpha FadB n=1 Tax=Pseudomonadaceae TaxID=135621 RepID=UPI000C66F9EE|nr:MULTISPECIES: fatty acid oxidation complex subunit alpha FadB [Pseudomonadaceae]MAX92059.1 fatty acid oxidation complex subunit alpha FadB [Pseudomonas sp.]MCQ4280788.1 fatty acid oxidation complex subunit alpha FadB [Stutzerimonas stutzeri]PNF74478.1 fatty acid oxidation complex subunit alpha FadB [Stutzerimonas stutzeri]VXC80663.1 fatty oxidation complex alpha subunit (Includes: Enoyl-CoA hydratase; Delta(3)-cis-delta(2)-trans-enoyl-CoA isomerase; 3-hydroxyacyl-CoA dehydrogenase; 3-hydroxy|tara:strand:- start:26816 stop:28963 length:2148 start_codon:yes stop_codon:yes gene_type:complete